MPPPPLGGFHTYTHTPFSLSFLSLFHSVSLSLSRAAYYSLFLFDDTTTVAPPAAHVFNQLKWEFLGLMNNGRLHPPRVLTLKLNCHIGGGSKGGVGVLGGKSPTCSLLPCAAESRSLRRQGTGTGPRTALPRRKIRRTTGLRLRFPLFSLFSALLEATRA